MIPEKTLYVSNHCLPVSARCHGVFSPATHQAATSSECLVVHLSTHVSAFMQWNCECLYTSALSRPSSSWMSAQHCTASVQLAPASPHHRHGGWAAAECEGGFSFALPPQPTAHLCCIAVQDAMIPADQECHCAYLC